MNSELLVKILPIMIAINIGLSTLNYLLTQIIKATGSKEATTADGYVNQAASLFQNLLTVCGYNPKNGD